VTGLPLVELKDVAGVTASVEHGELVVAGPTLLRTIAGLEKTQGEIVLDGERLYRRTPEAMARRGVVYLAARGGVFASLTVLENLRLGAWRHRGLSSRDLARAFEVFPALYERRGAAAQSLTALEQRLLALARAFTAKPQLLLAEEPTLGLPPDGVGEVLGVLRSLTARGTGVIVADERLARSARAI
jgi:branched-chain amino acid transport system ATP-binding protein